MGAKRERLGPRLIEAARSGERYRDVHVVLGGTGAVGGTAILELLSMYEEMFSIAEPGPEDVPVLVATGATKDEVRTFTRRLMRHLESIDGADRLPSSIGIGYLTASGVFVALQQYAVTALPGLAEALHTTDDRRAAVDRFLGSIGADRAGPSEQIVAALHQTVANARPFSGFLEGYRSKHLERLGRHRFRSVTLGIPIPSLLAYHQGDLERLGAFVPAIDQEVVESLKERFVLALRDDLARVRQELADDVLVAHTTGVGGMDDEGVDGSTTIRLGFAHAGLDRNLAEKHLRAEELTRLYAEAGIKVLITAAAIGVDEVRVREPIPIHRQIREKLAEHERSTPSSADDEADADAPQGPRGRRRRMPPRHVLRVFPPLTVPFDEPPADPARFEPGEDLIPAYAIRSGENGFFSIANADALYRVMRVATANELGLVLATVGLLGDDRLVPWFRDNVCYYTETDNARQVLDFLSQPALLSAQLSGLEPGALQDLGSAKHQAELHTLNLLILLQRLRTLDVDAIDPYVDPDRFDAEGFLLQRSQSLTFESVAAWDDEQLARDVRTMVSASRPDDLMALTRQREHDLFPRRREALRRVLERALRAVWTPPALGSPVLYEDADGRTMLRTGYYVAPLDLLVTETDAVARWLRKAYADSGNPCSFEDFRDYHVAVGGFIDLRPHAIVCAAKSDRQDLTGRVARFQDVASLRSHLWTLEPYSFFSTAGLVALTYRLRALYGQIRQALLELGSLHGWRWQMPRDATGHVLVVPGAVEAFRMVSEGLEKATGTERLDGVWGYEPKPPPDRRGRIGGLGPAGV